LPLVGVVLVGLVSLVFVGVVLVPVDFGVGVVSGIFGGLAVPVGASGLVAGNPEAFGVGVTAPGVVGVGVTGVVGVGVTAVGVVVGATATIVGWGLGAPPLFSAA
jgi:hypothetical protein